MNIIKTVIFLTAIALLTTGCATGGIYADGTHQNKNTGVFRTTDAVTGERRFTKSGFWTAVGTGITAVGAIVSKNGNSSLGDKIAGVGATIATVGWFNGRSDDHANQNLLEAIESTGAQLVPINENSFKVVVPHHIGFASGSSELSQSGHELAYTVAKLLAAPQFEGAKALVEGHTDSKGSESYNQTLSDLRAKNMAVAIFNSRTLGKDIKIDSRGYGEKYLIKDANGVEDKAASRRAEITIFLPVAS